jgi:YggT family protein
MAQILIVIISTLARVFTLLIIANVLLSYFLSPYHPVRSTLDRLVEPFLGPIRRVLPSLGGLDFSPLALLILIQVAEYLLISLVVSMG